ncbi:hypothetical protein HPB51_023207 [Rhipicephalus microplus]|uniref:Uncharacterized protein n=1 Tax=Rhipicephalus microplus TaxID=6941 RepID=A0A9J6DK56_RHIMP|nr:hypothetical protein HPB51_023207 [Rhipicephalus microplus]
MYGACSTASCTRLRRPGHILTRLHPRHEELQSWYLPEGQLLGAFISGALNSPAPISKEPQVLVAEACSLIELDETGWRPNATPGECIAGATSVVEIAWSHPPSRPSAAALTDASFVVALGLLVGRGMAMRLARGTRLHYRLQGPLGQAPSLLMKRTMARRSAIDPAGVRSALLRRGFSTCCCA